MKGLTKRLCAMALLVALASLILGSIFPSARAWFWAMAATTTMIAVFHAIQNLSERLWALQDSLDRVTHSGTVSTTLEVYAALAIANRFPGLTIPATDFSMRFGNLMTIIDLLDTTKPRLVVELGSGISTLLVAAWMREQGAGKVWSFEHDASWCEITRRHLERSGLSPLAEVVLAPLCERRCSSYRLKWYDLEEHITCLGSIDMLIVDGPPVTSDPTGMCRLPALEVFSEHLSPNAVIVLDDASRRSEQTVVKTWKQTFPEYAETFVPSLTGLSILRREQSVATRGDLAAADATQQSREW
jgi:predicted O-methyltransferase YrrM